MKKNSTQANADTERTPDISLYDKYGYDYSTYWTNRSYEHDAEVYALKKLLNSKQGSWYIDIGGSYGRHIPLYREKYKKNILLDYSLNALLQAQKELKQRNINNVFPVAANAYHLPFRSGVFDGGMMIRVIHHLENPDAVLAEITRTFRDRSTFILEFPNKVHIKSLLKALLRGDVTYLTSLEPARVRTIQPEGSKNEDPGIMLNFAPKHIHSLLSKRHLIIKNMSAISFLRIPLLKKLIGTTSLSACEHLLQNSYPRTTLTPSIILETMYTPENKQPVTNRGTMSTLSDVLACPACTGSLRASKHFISCKHCSAEFPITHGIPDLRYPRESLA